MHKARQGPRVFSSNSQDSVIYVKDRVHPGSRRRYDVCHLVPVDAVGSGCAEGNRSREPNGPVTLHGSFR